jgi:hypothetical protein
MLWVYGGAATLVTMIVVPAVLMNVADRRRRKAMSHTERKDDDYEAKAFTQQW